MIINFEAMQEKAKAAAEAKKENFRESVRDMCGDNAAGAEKMTDLLNALSEKNKSEKEENLRKKIDTEKAKTEAAIIKEYEQKEAATNRKGYKNLLQSLIK